MPSLREIFDSLDRPCDKFEHYFALYERHLGKFVGRRPRILEIGTQYGGSAEMWNKYFGAGTEICGVDIAPQCTETEYLRLIIGDQGSHEFWETNFKEYKDYFDIIIDDGSHDNPHQIVTLLSCYKMLKDGGVFWCEDTHTSYYHGVRVEDGGYKNPRSFTEFSKDIVDVLSSEHAKTAIGVGPFEGPRVPPLLVSQFDRIQGVHFYDSIVVIEKGERLKFQRVIHNKKA
ncbi:class I SAM-dependent methyltransferase [Azohydromonas lata]|uniref:Class I SAM-dependent methyltransferase n=1 Tax=Azohydromonas lata TaxID=45677 RepID=A0ABU5INY3_9BURK|nr:class I SAM-dependent methyltransferase [Azohydromonas lata]MDZ5460613.1 hypothetical protein [Azohydromonas lata]